MNTGERQSIPYGEQKLSEMLDFACEQLYPTDGFQLQFDGIVPTFLTLKELEAASNFVLDRNTGAQIKMVYNQDEQGLVLDELRHPLNKQPSMSFVIKRTSNPHPSLKYIQFLDILDEKEETPDPSRGEVLTDEDITRILAGYHLGNIPHPDHNSYRFWRADLLSKCQNGWKISEYVKLFINLDMYNVETLEVSNTHELSSHGEVSTVKTITKNFDATDGSGEYAQQYSHSLVTILNPYGKAIRLRGELSDIHIDPFVSGDNRTVLNTRSEAISLTQDSFQDFKRFVDDATLYLRQSRELND